MGLRSDPAFAASQTAEDHTVETAKADSIIMEVALKNRSALKPLKLSFSISSTP